MTAFLTPQTLQYLIYTLAAAAAILAVEALYVSLIKRNRSRSINRRLSRLGQERANEEKFRKLLVERGLTRSGDYSISQIGLNRLYLQSGTVGSMTWFILRFAIAALIFATVGSFFQFSALLLVCGIVVIGGLLPILVLRRRRKKRIRAFERQLPDALDMIVRSLRAGHPTVVAIGLVGREMQDPIGSEFGMAMDEITFGAEIDTALRNIHERVGFEGLGLLAMAVGIQSKTGGNLADILQNLGKTLRERGKMRLKIRALSAEGRISAIIMSLFPVVMFAILTVIAPTYYGEIWNNPIVLPTIVGFGVWAIIGDFIMFRMVNFDF